MQDASKGIVAKDLETENGAPVDRFAWRIKEVDLCIILYRNIWRIYVNLCTLIRM